MAPWPITKPTSTQFYATNDNVRHDGDIAQDVVNRRDSSVLNEATSRTQHGLPKGLDQVEAEAGDHDPLASGASVGRANSDSGDAG